MMKLRNVIGVLVLNAVLASSCGTGEESQKSWKDYGIVRATEALTIYETPLVVTHISADNGDTLAAAVLSNPVIDLFRLSMDATRLDSVGTVRLPLAPLEGIVRVDVRGSALGVISERNLWRYDLTRSQVAARVRTFVPLADVEILNDEEWLLTEYPVLNASSLVWLSGDFSEHRRFKMMEYGGDVTRVPSAFEFLISTVHAVNETTAVGLVAVSRGGYLGRFGRLGRVGEFHRLIDLLPALPDTNTRAVEYAKHGVAILDMCEWGNGVLILAESNAIQSPLLISTDVHGTYVDGVALLVPGNTKVVSIASMRSESFVIALELIPVNQHSVVSRLVRLDDPPWRSGF